MTIINLQELLKMESSRHAIFATLINPRYQTLPSYSGLLSKSAQFVALMYRAMNR